MIDQKFPTSSATPWKAKDKKEYFENKEASGTRPGKPGAFAGNWAREKMDLEHEKGLEGRVHAPAASGEQVCMYVCNVCMYVCTYGYVCMYVRVYVCMYMLGGTGTCARGFWGIGVYVCM